MTRRPPPLAPPGVARETLPDVLHDGPEVAYWIAKRVGRVTDRVVHLGRVRMEAARVDGGELRPTRKSRWLGLLGILLMVPLGVWLDTTSSSAVETFIIVFAGAILVPSIVRLVGNPNRVTLFLLTDQGSLAALEAKPDRAHELEPPLQAIVQMSKGRRP